VAWAIVFICSFIKGASGSRGVVPCGSWQFYAVAFLPIPIILVLSWRVGTEVYERFELKRSLVTSFLCVCVCVRARASVRVRFSLRCSLVTSFLCVCVCVCARARARARACVCASSSSAR